MEKRLEKYWAPMIPTPFFQRDVIPKIVPRHPITQVGPENSEFEVNVKKSRISKDGYHVTMILGLYRKGKLVPIRSALWLKKLIMKHAGLSFEMMKVLHKYKWFGGPIEGRCIVASSRCDKCCGCFLNVYLWQDTLEKEIDVTHRLPCTECGMIGHDKDYCCGNLGLARVDLKYRHGHGN